MRILTRLSQQLLIAILIHLALGFSAPSAGAQTGRSQSHPAPCQTTRCDATLCPTNPTACTEHWYGAPILITDAAAIAAAIGSALTYGSERPNASDELAGLALGAYALGAPIVHWSHGHFGNGIGSFAMRLGTPLALGYLGGLATLVGGLDLSPPELLLSGGFALGFPIAMAVDAALLAWDRPIATPSTTPSAAAERWRLLPVVNPATSVAGLRVLGSW